MNWDPFHYVGCTARAFTGNTWFILLTTFLWHLKQYGLSNYTSDSFSRTTLLGSSKSTLTLPSIQPDANPWSLGNAQTQRRLNFRLLSRISNGWSNFRISYKAIWRVLVAAKTVLENHKGESGTFHPIHQANTPSYFQVTSYEAMLDQLVDHLASQEDPIELLFHPNFLLQYILSS